jgi:hypothetical protein
MSLSSCVFLLPNQGPSFAITETVGTSVELRGLKATKSAKDFIPNIGAKLPKGIKSDGLPSELTQQIPQLADHGYAKI